MKKKIFSIFFCLIAALMILNLHPSTVTILFVNASSVKEQFEATEDLDDLNGLERFVYNAFSGEFADDITTPAKNDMIINNTDAGIMISVYNTLLPFALGLTLIYMLIDLIEKASMLGGRGMDEKFLFVALAKLVVAEWLLCQGSELIVLICGLNNSFLNAIGNLNLGTSVATAVTVDHYKALYDACSDMGWTGAAAYMVPAAIIYIANAVCSIAIRFQAISKKFEMVLLGSFSAVAMGGVFTDFSRGTAVRYLKKFMACALHAASILLIVKVAGLLTGGALMTKFANADTVIDVIGGALSEVLLPFLYSFASIGSISLAKSIINDAFGV